jgi:hypothetical protein
MEGKEVIPMGEHLEQPPTEYSEVNAHLRQLIINNVVSVQAENDRHTAFFERMKSDAAEFAATMRDLPGVWTESTFTYTETPPKSLFGSSNRQSIRHDFWIVREATRYGGSSLNHGNTAHDRWPSSLTDVLVIMSTGSLEVITAEIHNAGIFYYHPKEIWPVDYFVDRKPFDNPSASQRLRTEWVSDLEKAARKYSRR